MNTNQDTPTPRTDAIINTYLTNIFTMDYLTDKLTIESISLERELTAARVELAEQINLNKSLHYACVEAIRERDTAREQRDEARREAIKMGERHNSAWQDRFQSRRIRDKFSWEANQPER